MFNVSYIEDKEWDLLVDGSSFSTPYHNVIFMRESVNCIGGQLNFLKIKCNDENASMLMPVFFEFPWSQSGYFSTSGIGYGGPIPIKNINVIHKYIPSALKEVSNFCGLSAGCGKISPLLSPVGNKKYFLKTHLLPLNNSLSYIFEKVFSGSIRTAIRKANRENIVYKLADTQEEITHACRLIHRTQKDVGAKYSTPSEFLRRLYNVSSSNCEIYIALLDGKPIAAAVILRHRNVCSHWLHGWDRSYSRTCVNQGIIWHMIKSCAINGSKFFDFGISHNLSIERSKEKWGADQHPLNDVSQF